MLREHNEAMWTDKLRRLSGNREALWQAVKRRKRPANYLPALKDTNNTLIDNDQDKVNLLANTFSQAYQIDNDAPANRRLEAEVNRLYNNDLLIGHTPREEVILTSPGKINAIIKKLKNKKAPGSDNIFNRSIKNLPRRAIVKLTYIFNACLIHSYFPVTWKSAKVIALPKPNKPRELPTSYRQISLLPGLSKILERVILQQVQDHLEDNNILINEQFGFRNSHSTVQQVARVVDHILINFNHNLHTGLVALDLAHAFDSVWHKGLIYKLIRYNFPPYLIKLIKHYLRGRTFRVYYNDQVSQIIFVEAGVPQGSVLGPVIFTIYINDIPRHPQCLLALFADDTALYFSHIRRSTITNVLNKYLVKIVKFLKLWKLKLNTLKSEFCLFEANKKQRHYNPIVIDGQELHTASHVKYLGITLDKNLNFNEHVNCIRRKAAFCMHTLYPLIKCNSGLSVENKSLLYKQIVRPAISYGCQIYGNTTLTNQRKLQVLQNKFLRLCVNGDRYTTRRYMHERTGIEPFNVFVRKLSENFFKRLGQNNGTREITRFTRRNAPFRIKRKIITDILDLQPLVFR